MSIASSTKALQQQFAHTAPRSAPVGAGAGREVPEYSLGGPYFGNPLAMIVNPVAFQRRGHERTGTLFKVRVFDRTLMFVDLRAGEDVAKSFLLAPGDELSIAAAYTDLVGWLLGNDFIIDVTARTRSGLTHAYIERHFDEVMSYASALIAETLAPPRGDFDGISFFNDLVGKILCNYLIGPDSCRRIGDELASTIQIVESDYSLLGFLAPFETSLKKRRIEAGKRALSLVVDEVRRRRSEGRHDDFLQHLLDGEEGGASPDLDAHLGRLVLGVFFGAHTNTAMVVPLALLDLLENPGQLAAVMAQIDRLPVSAPLSPSSLLTLTELYKSLNETLRRRMIGVVWRKAMRPLTIAGYHIPRGALIGGGAGLVNQDPQVYPAAREYRPPRYDGMSLDRYQSPPVQTFPPQFASFGGGRSMCSGRSLAYTLVGALLVHLLRDYEWQITKKPWLWYDLIAAGVSRPLGSLRLRCSRRV